MAGLQNLARDCEVDVDQEINLVPVIDALTCLIEIMRRQIWMQRETGGYAGDKARG
jgi:hypothetical protein